jgi:hypothetical protein
LQAIAFVCKPDYLKKIKFSTQTNDMMKVMRSLVNEDWFIQQSASFDRIYGAKFAIRLTNFGYCFTFNIINASDLLNIDE